MNEKADPFSEAIHFSATPNDSRFATFHNQYPSQPPELERIIVEYINDMSKIGLATMHAIAIGLGLEETHFDEAITDPFWGLRFGIHENFR